MLMPRSVLRNLLEELMFSCNCLVHPCECVSNQPQCVMCVQLDWSCACAAGCVTSGQCAQEGGECGHLAHLHNHGECFAGQGGWLMWARQVRQWGKWHMQEVLGTSAGGALSYSACLTLQEMCHGPCVMLLPWTAWIVYLLVMTMAQTASLVMVMLSVALYHMYDTDSFLGLLY